MGGPVEVRAAAAADMPAFSAIVNHYIETTTVNFRTRPQTAGEWTEEWKSACERYPWLVATIDDEVVGIAYGGAWKARNAYDWCVETTTYVAFGLHRQGIARALYARLLEILEAQGYRTMIGVIGLPNDPSVALHESFGYRHAGTLAGVGYKLDRWCDIGFWQRVSTDATPPREILPVAAV